MDELELKDIISIIVSRWLLIAVLTLGAIILTVIVSYFFLEPVYESEARLMVLPKATDTTYSEIAASSIVSEEVIRQLKLPLRPDQLRDKLTINSIQNTGIISIKVQDKDPELTAVIANKQAEVFKRRVGNVLDVQSVQIVDPAIPPGKQVAPNHMMNIAVAGILGLMLGVFITFMLAYLDTTLKTPLEVEQQLELPVLGVIPEFK